MVDAPNIDLTVTVVSWNTKALLRACLCALQDAPLQIRLEIHVVDNASSDSSVEMVQQEFPHVCLLANQENMGFARANNQSWQEAQGRYWMLLNSDTEVKPGALDALVNFMDCHPKVGLATARLVSPNGAPQHCAQAIPCICNTLAEASRLHKLLPASVRGRMFLGPYWTYDKNIQVGWAWGTALIARREAVENVGPLSEVFFMYGEDLEWCLRMRRHGWEIWYCHEAEVLHHGGQSSAQRWDDRGRLCTILDGTYKAIERHRGRAYVRSLQTATLVALRLEWLASRVRGEGGANLLSSLAYHRRVLKRQYQYDDT